MGTCCWAELVGESGEGEVGSDDGVESGDWLGFDIAGVEGVLDGES